ncbi:alpha-D-xyloside xylohydrolase [Chryseolinea serpens]|uniref:Alpha-D-xyloside xylohydrolase n=2 Tax=Chryseolinea serpens TaxID=947013 RepID=A0A1M5QRY9_9BACT|nr:alpha-D-xyloside xylohydrolase [Chryseolinea serpens]
MKNVVLANIILMVVALTACSQKPAVEKLTDGVIVHPAKGGTTKAVRLRVIAPSIIQVTASAADTFSTAKSLIILPEVTGSPDWKLEEADQELTLITKALRANISLSTGEVSFSDSTGQVMLQEKQGGGKTFTPLIVDNERTYSLRQEFESPADEAFYGLGQHQEGLMNYKGKDVSLFQYNTKVAVPFLVSNKNYGILWDNYSLTRFGDPRDYRSLSQLKLYSREGKAGGLSATYGSKTDASKIYLSRQDSVIDYEFLGDQKRFPKEFPMRDGKVVWEGSIASDEGGLHKFFLYYAGYVKVWINNELKADHWRQAWNPGTVKFEWHAEKGKQYPVKIEWLPDGGESYLSLKWQSAPAEDQDRLSLFSEAGDQIDYYFMAGRNLDDVIRGYRTLTGKAEIFPKWAMGFWQSRERYKTQQEILDVVAEFRKRKIPLDNIVLDWSYWDEDKWGSQDFDLARFPDAEGMIKQLHEKYKTHFMISVWPKFYEGIDAYNDFDKQGFLYKVNIQNRQRDWIGKGYVSTFYDAYNPKAREAFWNLVNTKLNSKGVDGWWLDSTEPDILSNASIADRKKLMNPTALGSSTKYFNAYALMNEKAIYEGLRRTDPNKRAFIFTRSAFAGSQRYAAATWSGDVAANWQDFKTQIPAGLNFSLSGIPYWTTDIGGFSVEKKFEKAQGEDLEEWRERMTRWFQFGMFNPLFRVHGQYPYREMFNVAPDNHPAYKSMLYYDKLRYSLMPYIYSLAAKTYWEDYTIMRALVMDFPSDKQVLNMGNQFLFGPSFLVAPVTDHKARTWPVYLPANTGWYDLYTGKHFDGGQTIQADAPLERIPVFVKAGSIIPVGPELQYTAEKVADPLSIYVYTGANGSFSLYEDNGLNNDYIKGQYATIPLTYTESSQTLTLGKRQGTFDGMLEKKAIQIFWVSRDHPAGMSRDAHPAQVVDYSGEAVTIKKN